MAAEEHAQTPGEYIIHHLTHFGTGKPKGLVDFSVINFDSVVFSALVGVHRLLSAVARRAQGDVGRARPLPGRGRDAVRAGRQRGQGHRPQRQQPQDGRAAGADGVRLDLPAQCDGPAAGRPAAAGSGASSTAPPATTRSTPTCASCRPPTCRSRWRLSVGVLILCLFYSVKIKGLGGLLHELYVAPFGTIKVTVNPLTWIGFILLSIANVGDAAGRVRVQDRLARHAVVRQHVRGRADLPAASPCWAARSRCRSAASSWRCCTSASAGCGRSSTS